MDNTSNIEKEIALCEETGTNEVEAVRVWNSAYEEHKIIYWITKRISNGKSNTIHKGWEKW